MLSVMDIFSILLRFLGFIDEPAPMRQNIKRNRVYDDFSSDDETPVLGYKQVKRFRRSNIVAVNDKDVTHNNGERNVPVQVESSCTTSTPKDSRERIVPVDLPGLSRNGTSMLVRKTTLSKPEIAVEQKEPTVDLDEDDSNGTQQDDDVVFVEEVPTPTTSPKDNHAEELNGKILSRIVKTLEPEKNIDYQELLQLIATSKKPIAKRKPIRNDEVIDATSFGSPQKIQVLNKIKLNSELNVGRQNLPKVHDPVRVSSSDSSDSDVEEVPPESSSTSSVKEDLATKSRNWLLELDSKYNNVQKTQDRISDARRVSDITSKVNSDENIARSSRSDKTDTSDDFLSKLGSGHNKPDKPKTQEKLNDSRRTANFTLKEKSGQSEARWSSTETIDEWLAKLDAKYFSKPKPTEKSNDARPNAAQSSEPDRTEDRLSKLESQFKTDQLKTQTKLRDAVPAVQPESISKGNAELDSTKKWLARLEEEYFSSPQKTENKSSNARNDSKIVSKVSDKQNDVSSKRLESTHEKDLSKTQDQVDGALRDTNLAKENSGANPVRSYLPAITQNWLSELEAKYKTTSLNQKDEPRSPKPASLDDGLAELKSRCKVAPHVRQPEPNGTSRKSETEPKVNSEKSESRSPVLDTARQRLLKLDSKHKTEQSKNQIILDGTDQVVKTLSNGTSEQSEGRSFRFNTSEDLMMKLGALYSKYQQHKKSKNGSEQKHKHKQSKCDDSDMEMQSDLDFKLPALTPEQEELVNRGLQPQPEDEMLIEKFNMRIHRRDLLTLSDENWLNDEVINFYMNLIMQRSEERKDLPKVYATNTFFYPKLMQSGQAGLRRWTRKVDIFAYDLFLVPVNIGRHWCLCLVDFSVRTITYLDSRVQPNQECLDALLQYLKDEHQDKKKVPFDESGWVTECPTDIPQQMNGSDCGMFACTFAEFSARDAAYSFTQAHMPYLRRKAALEILSGKLLL